MLVVNLFGGPGTGKSTLAAALFSIFSMVVRKPSGSKMTPR